MDRKTLDKATRLSAKVDAYTEYISDIDSSKEDAQSLVISVHMPGSTPDVEIGISDKEQIMYILQILKNMFIADRFTNMKELEEL